MPEGEISARVAQYVLIENGIWISFEYLLSKEQSIAFTLTMNRPLTFQLHIVACPVAAMPLLTRCMIGKYS